MTFQINAWLEHPQPSLSISDKLSGATLMEWKGPQLHRLFTKGGLVAEDFSHCGEQEQQALARELFLLCCQD
ncbi:MULTISPECIES: hypothetical protein [Marinobacterium]|jgi:hypothetical protein|uniref:Uncharacterized protein n=1 Tax=Marinobacterium iners DSM 11526 TaxID=1122198 RepID=A0A1H3XMM7_9GAMM|nr:hypothetical protein [Marinobacterium iners]QSR34050.1 hypothetical protein CFI10_03460 [Marinobacterium iners]SEA00490.1 hypothetical protein SAMN02745729_101198 [Marinobacterium iners DSM 11526]